jgi:uncharacterized protein YcfJ
MKLTATAQATTLAILALVATSVATGARAAEMTDYAQVVSSSPIIEKITDVSSDCGRDPGYYRPTAAYPPPQQERSLLAPIVGGIIGGIVGKQVGQGNGNVIATAGGAIAGTVIGDRMGNAGSRAAPPPGPQYVEQPCRRVETSRDVVKGYTVVYRYHGRDATTTLPYNPGDRIIVGVNAIPEAR